MRYLMVLGISSFKELKTGGYVYLPPKNIDFIFEESKLYFFVKQKPWHMY